MVIINYLGLYLLFSLSQNKAFDTSFASAISPSAYQFISMNFWNHVI